MFRGCNTRLAVLLTIYYDILLCFSIYFLTLLFRCLNSTYSSSLNGVVVDVSRSSEGEVEHLLLYVGERALLQNVHGCFNTGAGTGTEETVQEDASVEERNVLSHKIGQTDPARSIKTASEIYRKDSLNNFEET